MTSKHTPGPWRDSPPSLSIFADVNGSRMAIAKCASMPCIGGDDDLAAERGMDMERANARLIAAAPELLEALEGIERILNEDTARPDYDCRVECAEIARAALAKAEGK